MISCRVQVVATCLFIGQTMLDRISDETGSVLQTELLEDIVAMGLCCVGADEQFFGDLVGRPASGDQFQYFQFATRQLRLLCRSLSSCQLRDQCVLRLLADMLASCGNGANCFQKLFASCSL